MFIWLMVWKLLFKTGRIHCSIALEGVQEGNCGGYAVEQTAHVRIQKAKATHRC